VTAEQRPRILLVTRNLPPLVGGMERLNWHMAEELAKSFEVHAIGPEGSAALAPTGVEVCEAPLRPLWKFLLHARALARREAKAWKPDIVLAGSGLTAPIARSAARACGAKAAVYVHGLDIAVQHSVYRAVWLPAIRRMDRVIANSRATADLCLGIGVAPERLGIVHPGVDLPSGLEPLSTGGRDEGTDMRDVLPRRDANPDSLPAPSRQPLTEEEVNGRAGFRVRFELGTRPILLSVGRLSVRKGLREFVAQCLPRIVAALPDTMLLIVGDVPDDALRAQAQSPDSIRGAAARAGVESNLRFLGVITEYDRLGAVYRAADVHVFPVREIAEDPEGFGMVAVEAAAHGLPTVAFATGGVVDAVAEGQSGRLVAPGDYAAFAKAVLRTFSERQALRTSCVAFARSLAWPEFGVRMAAQMECAATALPSRCNTA